MQCQRCQLLMQLAQTAAGLQLQCSQLQHLEAEVQLQATQQVLQHVHVQSYLLHWAALLLLHVPLLAAALADLLQSTHLL